MDSNKNRSHSKGISLKVLGIITSISAVLISITLVVSLWLISYENNVVTEANNNYIALKQASNDIQKASDDLTDYVRLFVGNADEKYMAAYFKEAKETKTREKALEKIHQLSLNTSKHEEIHSNIAAAVEESNDLMNLEYYAMKLTCVDNGISYENYPEVGAPDISAIAPENRKTEALNAVLGPAYIGKKDTISYYIGLAINAIDELMHENGVNAANNLHRLIIFQTAIVIVNGIFVLSFIFVLFLYVVRPMNSAVNSIKSNERIRIRGSREFNYLVSTYNEVRLQNEKVKEKLVYEAEHDKLTSLYNRTGYVSLFRRAKLSTTIYVLLDADGFKKINDEYGHEVGDRVLVRIAETLERYFKDDSAYVFRLGGDEFAILVENARPDEVQVIIEICNKINKELSTPKGKIPPITLSIGVAHGEDDDTTDSLFKKADIALYNVKHSGKSDVDVYHS